MVSKRPTETPIHGVQLQGGTGDHFQGACDISGPLNQSGTLLYRITGLARTEHPVEHMISQRIDISPALTWKPNANMSITFLAVAGVLLQCLTRNPMASPEVLVVSTGAALGTIALTFLSAGFGRGPQLLAASIGAVARFVLLLVASLLTAIATLIGGAYLILLLARRRA